MIPTLAKVMAFMFLGCMFVEVGNILDPASATYVRIIIAVAFADIVWSTRKK